MKKYESILILLIIIFIFAGIIFLRKTGILKFNINNNSDKEASTNILQEYYHSVNPNANGVPNVQEKIESMQNK